jgi:hypothetical protein
VNITQAALTASTTLIAVLLGGWLTTRSQERRWRRDEQQQWRDIRLATYTAFLTAFREYVSYVLLPSARITTVVRPSSPHDLMPFFDADGNGYKQSLEAAKTRLRLTTGQPDVVEASRDMVRHARLLAAARATHDVETLPAERFAELWAAESRFVAAARGELGTSRLPSADGWADRPSHPRPT